MTDEEIIKDSGGAGPLAGTWMRTSFETRYLHRLPPGRHEHPLEGC